MEKKKTKKTRMILLAITIFLIVTIISILGIKMYLDNNLTVFGIKHFSDSYIVDLAYGKSNIEKESILDKGKEEYIFFDETAESAEEAIEKSKAAVGAYSYRSFDASVIEETDMYYIVQRDYEINNTYTKSYKDKVLIYKASTVDFKEKELNLEVVNTNDKLKEISKMLFDYNIGKVYIHKYSNNAKEFKITYYDFKYFHNEYNTYDDVKVYKCEFVVDKETGKYTNNKEVVRELQGHYYYKENNKYTFHDPQ